MNYINFILLTTLLGLASVEAEQSYTEVTISEDFEGSVEIELLGVEGVPTIEEVTVTKAEVLNGEYVEVHCRITSYEAGQIVMWYKKQGDEDKVQLGSNNVINSVFSDTGRYTAKAQTLNDDAGSDVTYVIAITGAVAEDSGQIGCSIPSEGQGEKYATFTVKVPVQSVRLFGRAYGADESQTREYRDGDKIEFVEMDKFFFRCEAEGSNPRPDIHISLGVEGVSEKFVYDSSYEVTGGQPGLKKVSVHAHSQTKEPITISKEQNRLAFKCSAFVEGTEAKNITIYPEMTFRPVIDCPKTHFKLPAIKTLNLEVICYVKSDPHAEDIYLHWHSINNQNETLRDTDVDEGRYRMKIEDTERADQKKVTFVVDRLFPQTFRTYTMYARNSEGTTSQTIRLERDESLENAASQSVIVSMFTFTAAAIITMLM